MTEKRLPAVLQYRATFCLCVCFLVALLFTLRFSTAVNLVLTAVFSVSFLLLLFLGRRQALPFRLRSLAFLLLLASLLGALYAYPAVILAEQEEETPVTVRVESITYQKGTTIYFDGILTEMGGERCRIKAKFYCYDGPELSEGDVAQAKAEIHAIPSFRDAAEDEITLLANGFRAQVTLSRALASGRFSSVSLVFSRLRGILSARFFTALSSESAALLSGLLLGDTSQVAPTLIRNMNRLGISHLLAISGMHFTVLFIGLEKLLGRLGVGRHYRLAFVALASLFYLALTGFSAAVMRAGFMLLLMIIAFFLRLHYDTLTSLGVSLLLICLFTPYAVYHVGLWLSALATFGILALHERRSDPSKKEKPKGGLLRYIVESLSVTVIAIVATAPLTSLLFGTWPLLSPIANLCLAPFMDLLLYLAPLLLLFPRFSPLVALANGTVSLFT
ncbi:MAG: ComEC/Rec2 family competence protein, partial [Clostridia bacterium]|nr:ComEC/Rec2 family competence protein [Clostridia bacterium]